MNSFTLALLSGNPRVSGGTPSWHPAHGRAGTPAAFIE
jgi:hypothetical protein